MPINYDNVTRLLKAAEELLSDPAKCLMNGSLIEAQDVENRPVGSQDTSAVKWSPTSALISIGGTNQESLEAYWLLEDACNQNYKMDLKDVKDHLLIRGLFTSAFKAIKKMGKE